MRILVIEPHSESVERLGYMLIGHKIDCHIGEGAEDGVPMAPIYDYDAIVLALEQPETKNGIATIRAIRDRRVKSPIIVLSADYDAGNPVTCVQCLNAGADEFMPRPIDGRELRARLQAVVRRYRGHATSMLTASGIVIDIDARTMAYRGQPVHLTRREFKMMELLVMRAGRVVDKDTIMDYVYSGNAGDDPMPKIVDVYMCKVRAKMRGIDALKIGEPPRFPIETVWGRGWTVQPDAAVPDEQKADTVGIV